MRSLVNLEMSAPAAAETSNSQPRQARKADPEHKRLVYVGYTKVGFGFKRGACVKASKQTSRLLACGR
jgi:hypothetical protein